jgi:hypothetical protein
LKFHPGSFEAFTRFTTLWLNRVGSSIPSLIVVLLKLSLLALFFMYLWCFWTDIGDSTWHGARIIQFLIVVTGLVSLIFIVTALFFRTSGVEDPFYPQHDSVWPYIALTLLPLVAIVIANHWFGIAFKSGLLERTQEQLNKTLF